MPCTHDPSQVRMFGGVNFPGNSQAVPPRHRLSRLDPTLRPPHAGTHQVLAGPSAEKIRKFTFLGESRVDGTARIGHDP